MLLNLKQAAEYLGYSASGLRKLLRKPDGPPFKKIGQLRFRREELEEWIDSRTVSRAQEPAPIPRPKKIVFQSRRG